MDKLTQLYEKAVSRRNFMAGAGALGAAAVLDGCSSGSSAITTVTTPTPAVALTDADYLNFALNLEYLEASFYLYAATGSGLPAASMGTGAGTVTGGAQLTGLTSAQQNILNEIAFDELAHVNFLRGALGASAVAMPNINIGTSFQTLATAAASATPSANLPTTFSPYASFPNFLIGAFIFEDVGVTAYSGAAPLLTSAANLNYAAGIQAVEAYHAGYVRTAITATAQASGSSTLVGYANAVSTLRGTLGGGNETALVALPATIAANGNYTASGIVAASTSNSIGFSRTTDQVLHIVYGTGGGAGVSSGVFFPSGMNGNIKTTAS